MIPRNYVKNWSEQVPWQSMAQVEQDLIISKALVDLYRDPHIQEALVFRGGTALNKLYIDPPARYSEDLDFVQRSAAPIGPTIDAIRAVLGSWLGEPRWKVTHRGVKMIFRYESVDEVPGKLKVEINTTEHFQALPLKVVEFEMESDWFSGDARVLTSEIDELMATKLRALYQRRKGRDLFDMWYVVKTQLVDLSRVFDIFQQYCQYNDEKIVGKEFAKNMGLKRENTEFRTDMSALLPEGLSWDFEEAYEYVMENVVRRLET